VLVGIQLKILILYFVLVAPLGRWGTDLVTRHGDTLADKTLRHRGILEQIQGPAWVAFFLAALTAGFDLRRQ
jgi:hypothetical protein